MDLVTPSFGLVFWTTLSFLTVLFLLGKFAWNPIVKSIKDREESIQKALDAAKLAKEEMRSLQKSNEALLQQAREERDQLMKQARETKEQMISEAKQKARETADKMLADAREEIRNEKTKAMNELKNQVAGIAFEIAEKVLAEKLADKDKQQETVSKALSEIHFN